MKHNNLKQIIRKNQIHRIFLPVAVMFIAVTFLLVNPFEKRYHPESVSDISEIDSLYNSNTVYISIESKELYYSGSDYKVGNSIKGHIYYTLDNGHCYYFIISSSDTPKKLSTIKNITIKACLISNNSMFNNIIASMSKELGFSPSKLKQISSTTIISQYNYEHSLDSFYLIGFIALGIVSAIYLLYIILIIIVPELSSSVMPLRKYGNRKTLFAIAETEFDTAMASGRKNLFLTDTFFIAITKTSLDIIPLENIVWIYKYNEFGRSKGRRKMYHPLCIVTDHKKSHKIMHVSETVADRLISSLLDRYPEILIGYDAKYRL